MNSADPQLKQTTIPAWRETSLSRQDYCSSTSAAQSINSSPPLPLWPFLGQIGWLFTVNKRWKVSRQKMMLKYSLDPARVQLREGIIS
ncbi:hypothetical protein J6590_019100 [Homalodisca vitripennis]|nr:hypothetical protein J6590_019100 [Homalodisca vitripennis]